MRIRSDIWVKAYMRRCQAVGAPVVVARRGHDQAGAIYICVNLLNGEVRLLGPAPAGLTESSYERRFMNCFAQIRVAEVEADRYLARQADRDPDIWIVTVEDRQGRHFLEEDLIEELR